MGKAILIVGDSGSGKSTAVENLNPKTTYIINAKGKSLPWRGSKKQYSVENKNYFSTDQPNMILTILDKISAERTEIKTVVVDDWQYVSAAELMAKSGEKGYDKFSSIGKAIYSLADKPKSLREDLTVVFLTHSEDLTDADGNRKIKAKTVGKLIDNHITLEGMFTIVLYTNVEKTKDGMKYQFVTNTDGTNTAKSPKGMFPYKIDNDLSLVLNGIEKYENSEVETTV